METQKGHNTSRSVQRQLLTIFRTNLTKSWYATILNVTEKDSGNYTCLVENHSGENGSNWVRLDVQNNCDCQIQPVEMATYNEDGSVDINTTVSQDNEIIFPILTRNFDQRQFHWY